MEARTKDRWDQEKLVLMADFKRTYTGPGVNIEVRRSVLPHRTLEVIKGMRRQVKYRRLLEEGTSGSAHRRLSPPPPAVRECTGERPPSSTPNERSSVTMEADTTVLNGTNGRLADLAEQPKLTFLDERCLAELRIELVQLSAALGIELPQNTEDLRTKFDLWSPSRPARSQTTMGAARQPLPRPPGHPGTPGQRRHERRREYAQFQ